MASTAGPSTVMSKTSPVGPLPPGIDERFVRAGDLQFRYLTNANAGAPTRRQAPLLFLHGYPTWAEVWLPLAGKLGDKRPWIAPDLPCHNRSATFSGDDRSVSAYRAAIRSFFDAMRLQKAVLIGSSLGGTLGIMLALDRPGQVDRLTVLDAAGLTPTVPKKTVRLYAPFVLPAYLRHPRARSVRRLLERAVFHDPGTQTRPGSTRSWNSGSLVPVAPPSSPRGTLYDVPTRPWRPTSNASALGPLSSGAERIRSSIGRSGRPRRVASRAPSLPRSRIAAISRWSRSRRRPRRSCPTFSNPEKPVSGFPPGAELLRPRPGLEIVADPDALHLRVLVHRLKAELPTHAAHLGSAERRGRVDELVGIHPDHARLELRRDPVGAPQVARPEAGPESVRDAVGHLDRGRFVLEGRDRDERTEDFLLADSHLRVVRTDQRGLHVVPAGSLGRPRSASAEQDLHPFAFHDVHVFEHSLLITSRRDRALYPS